MTTLHIQLEGTNNDAILQEGDPINGYILLEAYQDIENDTAGFDTASRFNICQRTGMKALPGELLTEWHGVLVRQWSFDERNQQDFVRAKAEILIGPRRPEPPDTFITSDVTQDDL